MNARAALLLTTLLLLAPVAAAKPVGAPVLAVNDYWEFMTTIPTGDGTDSTHSAQTVLEAFETITVNGTSYEAARLVTRQQTDMSMEGMSMTSTTVSTMWTRVSDGASLRMITTSNTTSTVPGFPAQSSTSETTFSPPCVSYEWPIAAGDEWSTTCTSTTITTVSGQPPQTSTSTTATTWRALREESVTVHAGTFDAILLESTHEGSQKVYSWYAADACTAVKSSADAEGTSVTSELYNYRCAHAGEFQHGVDDDASTTTTTTPPTQSGGTTTPTGTTGATTTTTATTTPPTETAPTPGLPGPTTLVVLAVAAGVALLVGRRR